MGFRAYCCSGCRGLVNLEIDRVFKRFDDGRRDLILDREYVPELSLIGLRPQMRVGARLDELMSSPMTGGFFRVNSCAICTVISL